MYTTAQANLPRFNGPYNTLKQIIDNRINMHVGQNMGGINWRVVGSVLYLKNTTTGLWNRADTVGADPTQALTLANGVA